MNTKNTSKKAPVASLEFTLRYPNGEMISVQKRLPARKWKKSLFHHGDGKTTTLFQTFTGSFVAAEHFYKFQIVKRPKRLLYKGT